MRLFIVIRQKNIENNLVLLSFDNIFVNTKSIKVNAKKMAKSRENKKIRGVIAMVARRCGCTPQYAWGVINNRMGSYKGKVYTERDTPLAKTIRKEYDRLVSYINEKAEPAQS